MPKGTFNIVSTEDGTTPEQIVDNMSASVNVVFSADPVALQITPAEGKLTEITSITISYTDDNGTAYSLVPVITDSEKQFRLSPSPKAQKPSSLWMPIKYTITK